jgi:glutamyl/glutaminyl-tRNA synthetase
VRQSERQDSYRAAAERLGGDRFGTITLLREDGSATYHLASVVDDVEFGITHVIRGADHRSNEHLHRQLTRRWEHARRVPPPWSRARPNGRKLSKRDPFSSIADLRDAGIRPRPCAYPRRAGHAEDDVHLDLTRAPAGGGGDRRDVRRGAGGARGRVRGARSRRCEGRAT